jgi:hypothetical protein
MDNRKASLEKIAQGGQGISAGEQLNAQSLLSKLYPAPLSTQTADRYGPEAESIFTWLDSHENSWKRGWTSLKATPSHIAQVSRTPVWLAREIMTGYLTQYPTNSYMYNLEDHNG